VPLRQPVVIAVGPAAPAQGEPAGVADLTDRQAEELLARRHSVVAGLKPFRRGIGCAAADEQLIFRPLRGIAVDADCVVVVDDLVYVVASAEDRRAPASPDTPGG